MDIRQSGPGAFTLSIVASYIFSLMSGSLILIGGIANYEIAMGQVLPGPGMMPLMAGAPLGGGVMFPMMGNFSSTVGASLTGIIIGPIILVAAILLYLNTRQQMLWGSIIAAGAIASLLSGGGFFAGSVVGIVGGLIAITVKIG